VSTGLLDHKRATTHCLMFDLMPQRFPKVEIDCDAIFVQHGAVWTSAGANAGIDLALTLVEADCGHDVAMEVARRLLKGFEPQCRPDRGTVRLWGRGKNAGDVPAEPGRGAEG